MTSNGRLEPEWQPEVRVQRLAAIVGDDHHWGGRDGGPGIAAVEAGHGRRCALLVGDTGALTAARTFDEERLVEEGVDRGTKVFEALCFGHVGIVSALIH